MPDAFAGNALRYLFRPRSVAVVGASNDQRKFGGKVAFNIHQSDFAARYYVNVSGQPILGEPSCRSLADIARPPDAVVLAVPADAALAELRNAGELGVRAAVIFAGGFREAGGRGLEREEELKAIAAQHDIAVLGPNCVGAANFADRCFLSSADGLEDAPAGNTALVAQSGSLAIATASRYQGRIRHIISTGNETVVSTPAIISHLLEADPGVETFALLLETIGDRTAFARAAEKAAAAGKRIVLLKLAGSEASAKIAALHTGAVSGDYAPLAEFCRQHGIHLADSLRQFNAVLTLLSATSYRGGRRVGIFTTSGGTAVLSAGFATRLGLDTPQPPERTRVDIADTLGTTPDRITNPLDMVGTYAFDAERFGKALKSFADSGVFDLVLVPLGGAGGENALLRVESLKQVTTEHSIPIVPVWQQQRQLEEDAFHRLYESGLAMFTDFESPLEAMRFLAGAQEEEKRPASSAAAEDALPLAQALDELAQAGVRIAPVEEIASPSDAQEVIAKLGAPVALKASHPRLLHKSDAGMVVFPIATAEQLAREVEHMHIRLAAMGISDARLLVQAGVKGGVELLCGMARDVEIGPYAVLAAGGIYTEILRDSQIALAEPAEGLEKRIEAALRRLRIWPVLAGARGRDPYDWPAAVQTIAGIVRYFTGEAGPAAMEVNPLTVLPEGSSAIAVDVRILKQMKGEVL